MNDLVDVTQFAITLAKETGDIILKHLSQAQVSEVKDRRDVCTTGDLAAEKHVIAEIQNKYPDHHIVSEEIGTIEGDSVYTWIIDPIDGTKHYIKNLPLFAVSIALMKGKEVILGVVHDPSTRRTYHAAKDMGAFLNGQPIAVSETTSLDHAMIYMDITQLHNISQDEQNRAWHRLRTLLLETYRVRAFGLGSLGLCYLAQGGFDGFFDLTGKSKFVDVAAGSIIVREAGGDFIDVHGGDPHSGDAFFFASNGHLSDDLRKLINSNKTFK